MGPCAPCSKYEEIGSDLAPAYIRPADYLNVINLSSKMTRGCSRITLVSDVRAQGCSEAKCWQRVFASLFLYMWLTVPYGGVVS